MRTDDVQPIRFIFRRLRSLHVFTWVVALVVLAALVLIMVPGERMYSTEQMDDLWWGDAKNVFESAQTNAWENRPEGAASYPGLTMYEHGWPCVYLVRCTCTAVVPKNSKPSPTSKGYLLEASKPSLSLDVTLNKLHGQTSSVSTPIAWSNYDNWPFWSNERRLDLPALLLNLLVTFTILAIAVSATEFWVRRRGGLFRFRIVDLLVAFAVVAVVLTWLERQKQIGCEEWQVADYFSRATTNGTDLRCKLGTPRYYGPLWLERLAGSEVLLTRFHHIQFANLNSSGQWQEDLRQLGRLPRLTSIRFRQGLPCDAISTLAQFDNLEHLYVRIVDTVGRVGHDEFQELGKLNVQDLSLEAPLILAEDIEQLLEASPQLERLKLENPATTLAEIAALHQKYPKVELRCMWNEWSCIPTYSEDPPGNLDALVAEARRQRYPTMAAKE